MSGFRFLPHLYDMMSFNPIADQNIDYNLNLSKQALFPSLFMMPNNYGTACIDYPMFGLYGDSLLDANLAIQQAKRSFNFDFSKNNNKIDFSHIFDKTNNSSNSNSVADKVKQAEYDTLKGVLQAYNNLNNLSPAMKAEIEAALSKSGTVDEKLTAIKDVLKKVPSDKLKSAVLSNEKLKAKLASCGYNLSEGKLNKQDDAKLRGLLESVKQELNSSPAKYDTLLAQVCSSEADPDILRTISYWNDNNTNIIKMIAGKINKTKGEGTNQENAVKNLTMSLINKANEIQENYSSDFTNLKAAQKDVSDALAKVNSNNGFTEANLKDLATKFDKLYAILRMTEANALSSEAKTEYQKLLNDATGKTIIPDDFIVAETKADLKKEGVNIPKLDELEEGGDGDSSIDVDNLDTVEEKIEALKGADGNHSITDSAQAGVYMTNATCSSEPAHFYFVKDDKILKLNDVKSIDENGQCTMTDGSKKSLDDAKKNTTEVNPSDIKQYKATLARIEELTKSGGNKRLEVRQLKLGGNTTLYRSLGKDENGHYQRFVVRDNKLVRIICDNIKADGTICTSNGQKTYSELTDADFEEINDGDILKEDVKETVNKENTAVDINEVGEMYELADKLGLTETSICGYYRKGSKYYKYNPEEQKMEELKGVTKVNDDGTIVKNGKKVVVREIEAPEQAGKMLRKKLYADTSDKSYKTIKRKMNSFSTYTETDDIYKFLKAYEDERSCLALVNSKICAQIATETNLKDNEKKAYLKIIAKNTLKLAKKAGLSQDSEEMCRLKEFIKDGDIDTHWYSSWSDFWTKSSISADDLTVTARRLDVIIDEVLKEYEAKVASDNAENN